MDESEISIRFTYHSPKDYQRKKYEHIRDEARELASLINSYCSESREKSLSITKLEEAVMWVNAAIARREK